MCESSATHNAMPIMHRIDHALRIEGMHRPFYRTKARLRPSGTHKRVVCLGLSPVKTNKSMHRWHRIVCTPVSRLDKPDFPEHRFMPFNDEGEKKKTVKGMVQARETAGADIRAAVVGQVYIENATRNTPHPAIVSIRFERIPDVLYVRLVVFPIRLLFDQPGVEQ